MIARIATYSFTGDGQDLGRRAEAGILPILEDPAGLQELRRRHRGGQGLRVQRVGEPGGGGGR
jgi:hypothetical protein